MSQRKANKLFLAAETMALKKAQLCREKLLELQLHDRKIAEQYENLRERYKFSRWYQNLWLEEMIKTTTRMPKRTLDYCCGTSLLYPHVRKRFPNSEYVGIDLSSEMLRVGKRRWSEIRVHQQDGENLRFPKETFDLVLAKGAVHHLPDPEAGLKEINRVLKPGGHLILSEPTSNFIFKGARKILYETSSHFSEGHKSFSHKELEKLLLKSNFEIKKIRRFGMLAYPLGFPDIIPLFRFVPNSLARVLTKVDDILLKIPLLRHLSWSVIVLAEKRK